MGAPIPAQPKLRDPVANRFAEQTIAKLKELDGSALGGGSSGGSGVSDHGALSGLADNDHPQYLLAAKAAPAQAVWDGRVVPTGLHAHSDEFTSNTIANWTAWDHGGWCTSSIDTTRRCMELSGTGNATFRFAGRYKAVPSNEFTVLALFSFASVSDNFTTQAPIMGFFVAQNAAAANGDIVNYEYERIGNGTWALNLRVAADYQSGGSNNQKAWQGQTASLWMRMRVKITPGGSPTTDVWGDFSTPGDGDEWVERLDTANVRTVQTTYAAQHYGITFLQGPATASKVRVRHFRVFDGVSAFDSVPRNGGYLVAA